jgi:hypothetical protein
MAPAQYRTSGHDSPLGDQTGTPKRWTPAEVKKVSEDEVKNPADGPDVEPPDDPEADE